MPKTEAGAHNEDPRQVLLVFSCCKFCSGCRKHMNYPLIKISAQNCNSREPGLYVIKSSVTSKPWSSCLKTKATKPWPGQGLPHAATAASQAEKPGGGRKPGGNLAVVTVACDFFFEFKIFLMKMFLKTGILFKVYGGTCLVCIPVWPMCFIPAEFKFQKTCYNQIPN